MIWDGANMKNMDKALEQPVFILQDKNMEKGFIKLLELENDFNIDI